MRKTNLNIGDAVKQTAPRLLNSTHHGLICPTMFHLVEIVDYINILLYLVILLC